jgi:hypothetical protein
VHVRDAGYTSALGQGDKGVACEPVSRSGPSGSHASAPAVRDTPATGSVTDAVLGGLCTNTDAFIFGSSSTGQPLASVASGGTESSWGPSMPRQKHEISAHRARTEARAAGR